MGLRDKFKMSSVLETKGIQYEFENARVTLARAGGGNLKYLAAMEKLQREHGRTIQVDAMSSDRAVKLMREVFADTVILNWETKREGAPDFIQGIEDVSPNADDASPLLPFNRENVILTLTELPDLLIDFKLMAENQTLYRQANLNAIAGN